MQQYMPNCTENDQDQLINMILGSPTNTLHHYQECEFIPQLYNDQIFHEPASFIVPQEEQAVLFKRPINHYSSLTASQNYKQSTSFNPSSQQNPNHRKISFQPKQTSWPKKQKNSNTIKKIGRVILDNMKEYKKFLRPNTLAFNMLKTLSKESKVGRTEINKRDKFNTYHLRLLINGNDDELVSHNLRTTRKILSQHLRSNVFSSKQISDQNKALYLNTMKCSSLRCINKNLAVRLQMSMRQ